MSEPGGPTTEATRHRLPSGLLHDLRTPLNHIIGYSELMMEQAQEARDTGLLPHLQKVCAAAHHLAALIADNFESSRKPEEPLAVATKCEEQATAREPAPRSPAAGEKIAAAELASAAARGALMVVDDDAANRDLLSRRLRGQGYAVAAAENGRQALDMLRADTFDLVLLDIMMPDMDGYEVLRRLKADDRLKHLPVVVTSSLTEVDSVARCIELGAEDYLTKPFHSTLLHARVGASLERKRARDRETYFLEQLQENYRRLTQLEESRQDDRSHG